MANPSNFLMKVFPGRWTFWDKAKRAVRDACQRTNKNASYRPQTEQVLLVPKQQVSRSATFQQILLRYRANMRSLARVQQEMFSRPGIWGRGSGYFGRDFLFRRLRTGHLIGFATLFLVHEEMMTEDQDFRKRVECYENLCVNIQEMFVPKQKEKENIHECTELGQDISDYKLGKCIAVGSNGAVYEAKMAEGCSLKENSPQVTIKSRTAAKRFSKIKKLHGKPKTSKKLAIKMVFNLDSSNFGVICRQNKAELLTCGRGATIGLAKDWQNGSRVKMKTLPSHSNIVKVQRAFISRIPYHPEFARMHPAILPSPTGFGHSSAMFLVMKRYNCTLKDLLRNPLPLPNRSILSLQLLQGISHLERNGIAHRDLKSSNIFIEWDSNNLPRLVIGDFGCALVPEQNEDLIFPFLSSTYDFRNGTVEVQPPEITNCEPGPESVLDYTKADAWAAGMLLSEIMGIEKKKIHIESVNESAELRFFRRLILMLMNINPSKRISCAEAAGVLHLHLFGPHLREVNLASSLPYVLPVETTLQDWLLLHVSETYAYQSTKWGKNSVVCDAFANFFSSLSHSSLLSAFGLWQSMSA